MVTVIRFLMRACVLHVKQVKQKPTLKGIDKFKSLIHGTHGIEGLQEHLNSLQHMDEGVI